MKITQPRLPQIRLPHRRPRQRKAALPAAQPVTGILRVPRGIALALIATLVAAASLVSFAESYRGLYLWAHEHGLRGIWAAIWPLQVDVFIAVGELALFIALVDRWATRSRTAAWLVTLVGLAASVAGNVGHVTGHSLTVRATAAVPPLAAASALAVGLGVLKRVVEAHHQNASDDRPPAAEADTRVPGVADTATMTAPVPAIPAMVPDVTPAASGVRTAAADMPVPVADTRPPAPRTSPGHPAPVRTDMDARTVAAVALAGQPDMSPADLATLIGRSERQARRIKNELAAANGHAP